MLGIICVGAPPPGELSTGQEAVFTFLRIHPQNTCPGHPGNEGRTIQSIECRCSKPGFTFLIKPAKDVPAPLHWYAAAVHQTADPEGIVMSAVFRGPVAALEEQGRGNGCISAKDMPKHGAVRGNASFRRIYRRGTLSLRRQYLRNKSATLESTPAEEYVQILPSLSSRARRRDRILTSCTCSPRSR